MNCLLAMILFPMIQSLPISTNVTNTNTNSKIANDKIETSSETTNSRSDSNSTISRSDYGRFETHSELDIAFLHTNGTTYGDTFGNPINTGQDLPKYKNFEEELSQHPEFKGFGQETNFGLTKEFPELVDEFYRAKKLEKLTQEENEHGRPYPKFNLEQGDHLEEIHEKHPDIIYKQPSYEGVSSGFAEFKPSPEDTPTGSGFTKFKPIKSSQIYENTETATVTLDYPENFETEIIQKHIYVHVPPAESSEVEVTTPAIPVKTEKHYKIIFIKAPTQSSSRNIILPPPKQEKTLIYVLVKKPDMPNIFSTVAPTLPSKPEVYYIRYGAKRGTVNAKIAGNYPGLMDLEYNSSDIKEKIEEKPKLEEKM